MPEGDTIHRAADRLRPALVGKDLGSPRGAASARPSPPARHRDHGGRGLRQAPAGALRRRIIVAHAPAHDRVVAPLPHRRAVAEGPPPRAGRDRGRRLGRGVLQRPGGRARAGRLRDRLTSVPTSRAPRSPTPTSTPRSSAWTRSRATTRSPSRSSTSASPPASATCSRARCSSSTASTRSLRSPTCPSPPGEHCSPPRPSCSAPTPRAAGRRVTFAGSTGVYGRERQPCRRCGTPILRRRQGEQARSTYWCPTCQPRMVADGA